MRSKNSLTKLFVVIISTSILIFPGVSFSAWEKANDNGFGETNTSAWSMIVFENQLYVGTCNVQGAQVWGFDGMLWNQLADGGGGDPNNICISSITIFNKDLWAGTYNENGCQVGNSSGAGISEGFGDLNNTQALSMAVFKDSLFVGTYNEETGCEVWFTSDGASWKQANEDGFLDKDNIIAYSMVVFGNYLYVGTLHVDPLQPHPDMCKGSQIWRTYAEGEPPFVWEKINEDGFGDLVNFSTDSMVTFNGYLYAETIHSVLSNCA